MAKHQTAELRHALMEQVFWGVHAPVSSVAEQFKISRQAVAEHARFLARTGRLIARGDRRWRRYELANIRDDNRSFPLGEAISEDQVWDRLVVPNLKSIAVDAESTEILNYGLTEIVNNAIDHSEGKNLQARFRQTAVSIELSVIDDGLGIFQKIASSLKLSDPRQALLELGKGKFTTDPARHTGEGVFFTSRSFDRFSLQSSDLLFARSAATGEWLTEEDKAHRGTRVTMSLLLPARRSLAEVFKRHSSGPDEYRFAKTHVPLILARFGDESLLSRSSAKRVLARIERFDEVLLDFKGVKSIGPAFADEIFRVFASRHPKIQLIVINANEQVTSMVRRAQQARDETGNGTIEQ
ncbi:MAG TPA: DUF4325 domain-containing protein [Tepidisphaeraceae bacterium]|jgi:anti-sigma regulatory factor (Ser/Thr protein kinase)